MAWRISGNRRVSVIIAGGIKINGMARRNMARVAKNISSASYGVQLPVSFITCLAAVKKATSAMAA